MSEFDDGDWEVAVDKKKINRQVRRERKEAEAQRPDIVGGETEEEFDLETRRRMAAASFYGAPKQKKKAGKFKNREVVNDFDEAGWTGKSGDNNNNKNKKSKPKAAIPQYDTADEIAEALADIITRVPPTSKGIIMTIAALGDKLQTLTKQQWNKRYKSEFGSLKKFLESRPEFNVNGDEVSMSGNGTASSNSSSKVKAKKTKADKGSSGSSINSNEEDESEDDGDVDSASSSRSRTKTHSSTSSFTTVASFVVLIATAAAFYYYSQLKR